MSIPVPRTPEAHLAHSELSSPMQMTQDCLAAGRQLERATFAAVGSPPSLHYADFPREVSKPEINVDAAAARLANALHLHLD